MAERRNSIKRALSVNLIKVKTKAVDMERRASLKLTKVKSKVSLFADDMKSFKNETKESTKDLSTFERAKRVFRFKPFSAEAHGTHNGLDEHFMKGSDDVYYLLLRVIGKGAYGVVRLAVRLDTKKYVAIKTLSSYHSKKDALKESDLHKVMGTSRGEPIYAPFGGKNSIVMKLIDGRKLETEYLDPESKCCPLKLYRKSKALLNNLHSKGYYHGDTNTGNFIVEAKTGKVYLVDYGDSGNLYDLDRKYYDYKKLALNTISELKFRLRR